MPSIMEIGPPFFLILITNNIFTYYPWLVAGFGQLQSYINLQSFILIDS